MPSTIVDVIEMVCEGAKMKHRNAALSVQNTDMKAKFVGARAARGTVPERLAGVERRTTALETQAVDAQLMLEKLASMTSRMDADL